MADVLVINGATIDMVATNSQIDRLVPYVKGGIPEMHLTRLVGALAALPDTWSGKACTLTMSGTLRFAGDVQGYIDHFLDGLGWVREYRALGLRNRADYIAMTDAVTLTDTATFNLQGDDPNFVGSKAGLTVGQIVTQVLTMQINANALNAAGIGQYTSLSPPALPAQTVADLGALTIIPPWRVQISGERILQTLEGFIQSCHPNHWLNVEPNGTIRVYDLRTATPNTLTLGSDARLGMPSLTRDFCDCYSQVEVRGNTIAIPMTLQTTPWQGSGSADGGLQEWFQYGAMTNAAAKAAFTSASFNQPSIGGTSNDFGSCTIPDTTHAVVTSHDATATWAANFWGQGAGQASGEIYLYADIITGISQLYAARIVANTALTAGGTSILTLDRPLPAITYNSYQLWGLSLGPSMTYRRYKVTNATIAASLLNFFPYPVPIMGAGGAAAALTSTPVGMIQWSNSGTPPYNTSSMGITVDPVNGFIYFDRPTAMVFGTQVTVPNNVIAFVPVANGSLNVFAPSSSTYSGTLSTVEGIHRTKVITCRDWRDVSNVLNMQVFANEFLDSVSNVVVEGTVPYYGLAASQYLSAGQSISITGSTYTTGWEGLALPVVSVEIVFQNASQGTSYQTVIHLSNRRGRYTSDQFLRPNVTGQQVGSDEGGGILEGQAATVAEGPTGPGSAWSTALSADQGPTGNGQAYSNVLPGNQGPTLNAAPDDANTKTVW